MPFVRITNVLVFLYSFINMVKKWLLPDRKINVSLSRYLVSKIVIMPGSQQKDKMFLNPFSRTLWQQSA